MARYSGLAPLARPLVGGIGAILMLHRVTAVPEKPLGVNRHLNIAPDFLDAVISDMKAHGYDFVSMDEAVERIGAAAMTACLPPSPPTMPTATISPRLFRCWKIMARR